MSLTRRIAHNTIIQVAGKAISIALGLATIAMMTRYLGKVGFGQYTTITAFLQVFTIFVDMGLALMMVQMISKPNVVASPEGEIRESRLPNGVITESKLVSNFISLRFISILIFLALAPLIAIFIPSYSQVIKIGIAITAVSFFFGALIQVLMGVFQKHLHMERVAIAELVGRLFLVGFTVLAIFMQWSLYAFLGAMILGGAINFLCLFYFSRRFVKIRFQIDLAVWKSILKQCWPIALSIAFNLVYFKADTIILSLTRSQAEVGIYGATYRVLEIAIVFPIMFINLVLPFLTRSWANKNLDKFKNILQKSFDFLVIAAVPMVIAALFLGTRVMTLVAGQQFEASGLVLKFLIIATAIIFIGNLFGHIIVAIDKQKQMLKYYILTAIIGLIGYLILIPKYSYFGAAGMTIVAEVIIALAAFLIVWRTTKVAPKFMIFWKSLLASLIMAVPLYFLRGWNLFLLIAISGIIYFTTLYSIKGFSKEMIKEVVKLKS
ncbi:flippase [Patescibacteria group bacterium]|nr:flippase [Patescibacteria group bacterium]MBU4512565.1 flippase [Patescibacteria group bacterium]MCG2692979.1 flippase [Candidatus Parcubacteria bacterium]